MQRPPTIEAVGPLCISELQPGRRRGQPDLEICPARRPARPEMGKLRNEETGTWERHITMHAVWEGGLAPSPLLISLFETEFVLPGRLRRPAQAVSDT